MARLPVKRGTETQVITLELAFYWQTELMETLDPFFIQKLSESYVRVSCANRKLPREDGIFRRRPGRHSLIRNFHAILSLIYDAPTRGTGTGTGWYRVAFSNNGACGSISR